MTNLENGNQRPLLVFLLARDGDFDLSEIWSVLHRHGGEFDMVLVDHNNGLTKVPHLFAKAALKTLKVGKGASLGKTINSLVAETNNGVYAFLSDRVFPTHDHWLKRLCEPIFSGKAEASFGREVPAPGGNYFLNNNLEKLFPASGDGDVSGFSIDNCAVTRDFLLKKPFPENALFDPAGSWAASSKPSVAYSPEALVLRHTLLSLKEIYWRARAKGEDASAFGERPSIIADVRRFFTGVVGDVFFALSIKRPQYVWYPFLYKFALHFGYYLGTRKK
ncbi:MAG: hypothetical protein HY280_08840 [Nitrospinae bacterium]|nr:hypothetical protein [Nitrospinota bacterium]